MFTTWNSGREYSAKGQRIAAEYCADGFIRFADADRNLDGEFDAPFEPFRESDMRDMVMHAYDHNHHRPIRDLAYARKLAELARGE